MLGATTHVLIIFFLAHTYADPKMGLLYHWERRGGTEYTHTIHVLHMATNMHTHATYTNTIHIHMKRSPFFTK